MKIFVTDTYEQMSRKAANIIAAQVQLKPNSNLGLATGGTPVGMYKQLIKMNEENDINFENVRTFNLDEYYPIDKNNDQSYYTFMNENLFKHVNINEENTNIPNGMADNIEEECKNYDNKIEVAGGVDIQVLGIGHNGHIGFNEPDGIFTKETNCVELTQTTINANVRFFNSIEEVPKKALTMGIGTIMKSKKILLLASGEDKAEIIRIMIEGNIDPKVPASVLQLHPDVTIVLDKKAAGKLSL